MNETVIHVVGHIGTDIDHKLLPSGSHVSSFRLASTPRHYSKAKGGYVDEVTNWIRVECWRSLAVNVSRSLHRGQPVVVVGRLKTQEWTREGVQQSRFIIEAISVGHDLARGVSTFTKVAPVTEAFPDHAEAAQRTARDSDDRTPIDIDNAIASAHDDGQIERFLADAS